MPLSRGRDTLAREDRAPLAFVNDLRHFNSGYVLYVLAGFTYKEAALAEQIKTLVRPKKMKTIKKSGTLGLRAGGGFLAFPECVQPGALAGALDPPCRSTLDFFAFFCFLIFFEKAKKTIPNF